MELTTTYKRIFLFVLLLSVVLVARAQQLHVVVGSTRTVSVDNPVTENVYKWQLFNTSDVLIPFSKDANKYIVSDGGNLDYIGGVDPSKVDDRLLNTLLISWNKLGEYILTMTETSIEGCSFTNKYNVKVERTPLSAGFVPAEMKQYDIINSKASLPNKREIEIPLKLTNKEAGNGILWADDYYSKHDASDSYIVTFKYKVYTSLAVVPLEKEFTVKLKNGEYPRYSCVIDYARDFGSELDETTNASDYYFTFEIYKVVDKYGADVDISLTDKIFTYGIYRKTTVTKINRNN